jgi:aspartate aminotransferase
VQAAQRFAMARLSPPALGQVAAAAITEIPDDYFPKLREVYRRRRDAVVGALRNIQGVRCPQPEGAFYTMVGLPLEDTDDFARFMLADFAVDGETVMLAPGSGFYKTPGGGRDEVRIAYVLDEKRMRRAIEILGLGIEAYCERVAAGAPTSAPSHTPSKA